MCCCLLISLHLVSFQKSENKNIYTHFTAAINPDTKSERKEIEGGKKQGCEDDPSQKHVEGKNVEGNYDVLQSAPSAAWYGGVQRPMAR